MPFGAMKAVAGPIAVPALAILLVEDDPLDAELTQLELERFGHRVSVARSGEEALALYASFRPDLVVTDISLPGMCGCELTRQLKSREHPHWLPVLFMSGTQSESSLVEAYQAGADDFIHKPISRPVLQAKLGVFQQRLHLQREAQARERLLQRYRDQVEEEKSVALHLMHRLVNAELLGDLAVSHWMRPAETYSGDLIAAARTPGGILHVLLADATGHGLAASLAVMPVTQPFYRMTEKGFGIDAIAREMNRKVAELLPVGRFVAATLAAVDSASGSIQVWNGGNPPPFLVNSQGLLSSITFAKAHLPLGILADEDFDASTEVHFIEEPKQLVIYSDGVVEAENGSGTPFGRERLLNALLSQEREERLAGVVGALDAHLAGRGAQDDLSLMLVHCYHQTARSPRIGGGTPRVLRHSGSWQVTMSLSADDIRNLDPVPTLMGVLSQFNRDKDHGSHIFLILSELYNNALDHGVLGLDSGLKAQSQGFERYLEERGRRLAALRDGTVDLEVTQQHRGGRTELVMRVRDSGPGFDHAAFMVSLESECSGKVPHGRGIRLVHSLCSALHYCAPGNEVIAYYDMTDFGYAGDRQ